MTSVPAGSTHLPGVGTDTRTAASARPRVLLAALAASAGVAALTLLSHALVLAGGRDAVRDAVLAELPEASSYPALVEAGVAQAQDTLQTRAVVGFVVAGLVLLFTVLSARAGRVARGVLVAALAVCALLMLRSVTDLFPAGAQAPGVAAVVLAPVAAVLLLLPPVGRYRAARHRS